MLEDVSNPKRLLSIGKELLKIYNDKNRKELEELRHRLYDKLLLEILHPVEFE